MDSARRFRVTFDTDSFPGKTPTVDYRVSDMKTLIAMIEASGDSLYVIKGIQDVTDHPEHCRAFVPEHSFVPSAWITFAYAGHQVVEMHCSRCLYRVKLPAREDIK
jgi:hypothetical protein